MTGDQWPRTGTWSEPAFYMVDSVTFGLQIWGEATEMIMVATNQKAIDSYLSSSIKVGGMYQSPDHR